MTKSRTPRKLPAIPAQPTLAVVPVTINDRISAALGDAGTEFMTITDEQVTALRAIFAEKAPRTNNPDSVSGLTRRYNDLVPQATALGIKGVKHHTSYFGTVAGGKATLAKLEQAIAQAQQAEALQA